MGHGSALYSVGSEDDFGRAVCDAVDGDGQRDGLVSSVDLGDACVYGGCGRAEEALEHDGVGEGGELELGDERGLGAVCPGFV
jgi:hypothetical protein